MYYGFVFAIKIILILRLFIYFQILKLSIFKRLINIIIFYFVEITKVLIKKINYMFISICITFS